MSDQKDSAVLIAAVVQPVLFGIGLVSVLAVPSLAERAGILLPIVIVMSLSAAAAIGWFIAARVRFREGPRRLA